jgi:hypothetical protein
MYRPEKFVRSHLVCRAIHKMNSTGTAIAWGPVKYHEISQSRPPVHKQRLVQLGVAVQSMLKLTKKTLFRIMDRNCLMHLMVLATQTSGKSSQISEWNITKKLTDAWMIYLLAYARCLLLVSFNSVCALNTPPRVCLASCYAEVYCRHNRRQSHLLPYEVHSYIRITYCLQPTNICLSLPG